MLSLLKSWNYKEDLTQLKKMFRLFFPKGKSEVTLFIVFFLIYGSLATFLALATNITDQPTVKTDAYFSFDNALISHHGFQNLEGHPLMALFTFPIIYVGIIFNLIFATVKAKALFLVLICTYLVSSSIIYIYRYLKEIINLNGYITYLLTCFYATTSTLIILSFTFESYTYSLFLLTFSLYYYSYRIKNQLATPFSVNIILAISLGGITITNFVKGLIPILFISNDLKLIIKRVSIISAIFISILIVLEIKENIFSNIQNRLDLFIIDSTLVYKYIIDFFWGAAILFPYIIKSGYYGGPIEVISTDFYAGWWQYLIVSLIFIFMVGGSILNYKNKLIYIPILFFMVDIFIHVIMKYGINEGIIYGGHWVFLIPILIGWLYKSLKTAQQKALEILLSLLFIALCVNNIIQMNTFIKLAQELFPAS